MIITYTTTDIFVCIPMVAWKLFWSLYYLHIVTLNKATFVRNAKQKCVFAFLIKENK
jgi:hypothetical protein